MLSTNREILFRDLITELYEILVLNEIESKLDADSYASGFQGLAGHILSLIQSMEEAGSTPREIIEKIKTLLDDGSPSILQ
ncbi:MAG: hypothetical protein NHB14_01575 [Desulfosporosinus sp.]|nr:hypothetical protein [Desulfosporosinus sp.]